MQSSLAKTEMFNNVKGLLWLGDISWRKEEEKEEKNLRRVGMNKSGELRVVGHHEY